MIWVTVGAFVILGFFAWANSRTARTHRSFTRSDVEAALVEVVAEGSDNHDDWDLFLAWPIADPYLELIRRRCLEIVREHPPTSNREDIGAAGVARLREILKELRERA